MNAVKKPHKHAEVIKAWADGAEVQYESTSGHWSDVCDNLPVWNVHNKYRVKPREFPKSSLGEDELLAAWHRTPAGTNMQEMMRQVADAAVKQYILDCEATHRCAF